MTIHGDEYLQNYQQTFDVLSPESVSNRELLAHEKGPIATPEACLALLHSHKYKRFKGHHYQKFLKTRRQILALEKAGVKLEGWYKDWSDRRAKETYNYSHPSLKRSKANFFKIEQLDNRIFYVYDHDWLHEAFTHFEKPAYTYFIDGEVWCSKDKFFNSVSENVRLHAVLEEAYVLAIERSQVPTHYRADPNKSFFIAMGKICTSITSGWFREYAWDNYDRVIELYDPEYVRRFDKALEDKSKIVYDPRYSYNHLFIEGLGYLTPENAATLATQDKVGE